MERTCGGRWSPSMCCTLAAGVIIIFVLRWKMVSSSEATPFILTREVLRGGGRGGVKEWVSEFLPQNAHWRVWRRGPNSDPSVDPVSMSWHTTDKQMFVCWCYVAPKACAGSLVLRTEVGTLITRTRLLVRNRQIQINTYVIHKLTNSLSYMLHRGGYMLKRQGKH